MQHVNSNICTEFQTIEDALGNNLLLYLFKGATYQIPRRAVTGMSVNQAGISLLYPTETAISNCTASCVIKRHLVPELHMTAEFRSVDHDLLMVDGRDKICWQHAEDAETALGQAWDTTSMEDARRMGRITQTGAWMSVLPSTVHGKKLGAQEWRDYLFLH